MRCRPLSRRCVYVILFFFLFFLPCVFSCFGGGGGKKKEKEEEEDTRRWGVEGEGQAVRARCVLFRWLCLSACLVVPSTGQHMVYTWGSNCAGQLGMHVGKVVCTCGCRVWRVDVDGGGGSLMLCNVCPLSVFFFLMVRRRDGVCACHCSSSFSFTL